MAIHTLEFRTQLTDELDKVLVAKSATSFMLDNAFGTKFTGAKTVLIPEIDFQGLGNYDRNGGFPDGSVTLSHKPYTLTQERARSFQIDRMDMDEAGIAGLAGNVMGEFVRTQVAPEMDAYILSKAAKIAIERGQLVQPESGKTMAENCLKMLGTAIKQVQDVVGFDEELVAFCNTDFNEALRNSPELERRIVIGSFKKGEVSTQVKKLDECALIPVSNARMRTDFSFLDGTSEGEQAGGFAPAEGAQHIGFIVVPKRAIKLVKKTEKVRTFLPDENQNMDAYKFDYRLFYDALVKNSELGTIWAYTYEA